MMKVYIETLDPALLQSRLESLLDEGGVRVPHNRYLATARAPSGVRGLVRRWGWTQRLVKAYTTWKLSGWSLRWLGLRIPLLGPFVWWAHGVLTQREFRRHTLAELGQLGVGLQALQAGLARLEANVASTLEPAAAVNAEFPRLREQVELSAARLRDFERGLGPAASSSASQRYSAWYLALENSLRGDVADIERRLEAYLPCLDCAQVGQPGWPVLDLGCGRGEWLRLLRARGFLAQGVDTNEAMLECARSEGLAVFNADLIAALRAAAPSTIGAVTAFQVVEHLDPDTLLELFDQAWRVLHPGGVLLLETPNPENLQVGAYSFWLDPTHVRPIPPPLLAHSAAHFGFIEIAIVRSNPWRENLRLELDGDAARHFEKLMFSAQDYALVARKPYAQDPTPALAAN